MNDKPTNKQNIADIMVSLGDKIAATSRNKYLCNKGINPNDEHVIQALFPRTMFENGFRNLPNDIARSCLFSARGAKEERKSFHRQPIFHLCKEIEILYTGQELCARDDELVWLQLIHYCRYTPLGKYIEFGLRQFILDIGWPATGTYYQKVRDSFSRLAATEIYIKNSSTYGISGGLHLIDNYVGLNEGKYKEPTKYRLSIDKNLIALFAGNTFTNIPWDKYKSLSPMGRRLTDYALSHRTPNPLPIIKFLYLCQSEQINSANSMKKQTAQRICSELVEKGVVANAFVANGNIYIKRHEKKHEK